LIYIGTPLIFLFIAYIAIWESYNITWQLIVVLVLAWLPFLLPFIARYIKKIGKDGLEMNEKGNIPREIVELKIGRQKLEIKQQNEEPPKVTTETKQPLLQRTDPEMPTFGKLNINAQKVLRTLWFFQKRDFPKIDKYWGFLVSQASPDYSIFLIGEATLSALGFTFKDPRGMVFLKPLGINFCQTYTDEILEGNDIWTKFGSG